MSRLFLSSISTIALFLMTMPQTVGASVIYDNSGSSWTSTMSVSSYFYQAQSFRSSSEASYLHSISLGLLANDGTDSPFFVQLYDGLYAGLGTTIITLTGPINPGTGMIVYFPSTPVLLSPDTTYWVLARAYGSTSLGSPYGWRIADEDPSVGVDSGRNMYYSDSTNQWVGPSGPGDFIMTVEIVPEPSMAVFGAISAFTLCLMQRRLNAKTQAEQAIAG